MLQLEEQSLRVLTLQPDPGLQLTCGWSAPWVGPAAACFHHHSSAQHPTVISERMGDTSYMNSGMAPSEHAPTMSRMHFNAYVMSTGKDFFGNTKHIIVAASTCCCFLFWFAVYMAEGNGYSGPPDGHSLSPRSVDPYRQQPHQSPWNSSQWLRQQQRQPHSLHSRQDLELWGEQWQCSQIILHQTQQSCSVHRALVCWPLQV